MTLKAFPGQIQVWSSQSQQPLHTHPLSPPSLTMCSCPSHHCGSPDASCCITNTAPLVWNTLSTLHSLNTSIIQSLEQTMSSLKWAPFQPLPPWEPLLYPALCPRQVSICTHLCAECCARLPLAESKILKGLTIPSTYWDQCLMNNYIKYLKI